MPPNGTGQQGTGTQGTFGALSDLLRTAIELTADLARDHQLPRLLEAFGRFPSADRKALIEKLESEVHARQRSMETGDGKVGPPNPLGSLYVRVYENGRPPPAVTRDTMLRSTIQSTALMLGFPKAVRIEVEDALLGALAGLDAADAEALARHHEDLLALAARCGGTDEGEST